MHRGAAVHVTPDSRDGNGRSRGGTSTPQPPLGSDRRQQQQRSGADWRPRTRGPSTRTRTRTRFPVSGYPQLAVTPPPGSHQLGPASPGRPVDPLPPPPLDQLLLSPPRPPPRGVTLDP
ncbi:unnamed protein product [Merluccius merluccius]